MKNWTKIVLASILVAMLGVLGGCATGGPSGSTQDESPFPRY